MTDYSVQRDRFGKPFVSQDGGPLIFEKGRKTPSNAIAYQRVSTLAGTLDDKENLFSWKAATAMIGTVRERSIYAQVASLVSKHRDPWKSAKTQMKQLAERAATAASSDDGSGKGTAFHEFTEIVDEGRTPEFMPIEFEPWIDCYRELMQDFEVLAVEQFVVVDELKVAGSFDKLVRHKKSGKVMIEDTKTGSSDPSFPLKGAIQFACYAHGELYDQETGKRTPVHPDIDLSEAVMVHVPIRSGVPSATAYSVDIAAGWEYAKLASQVKEARKMKALEVYAA